MLGVWNVVCCVLWGVFLNVLLDVADGARARTEYAKISFYALPYCARVGPYITNPRRRRGRNIHSKIVY